MFYTHEEAVTLKRNLNLESLAALQNTGLTVKMFFCWLQGFIYRFKRVSEKSSETQHFKLQKLIHP